MTVNNDTQRVTIKQQPELDAKRITIQRAGERAGKTFPEERPSGLDMTAHLLSCSKVILAKRGLNWVLQMLLRSSDTYCMGHRYPGSI